MADFETSYQITAKLEGGYANNPKDKGGETYAGISRKFFPNWEGWAYIDQQAKPIKSNTIFPQLIPYVRSFYIQNFWNKIYGNLLDQVLANQLFDFAVHSGIGRAVKSLQSIVNQLGESLKVDGMIGYKTLAAIKRHDQSKIAKQLHDYRAAFVSQISSVQPSFAQAWKNRIEIMKSYLPSAGISLGIVAILGLSLLLITKN